ncbi:MAG TPA: G5 domain-containing protein [Patescibacteria group bacterium]
MQFTTKRFAIFFILLLIFFLGYKIFFSTTRTTYNFSREKIIFLNDNGLVFAAKTSVRTVADWLDEKNIKLAEHDNLTPDKNTALVSGTTVMIQRAVKIKIQVDGKTLENWTLQKTIAEAISENSITLGRLDKVVPEISFSPRLDMPIIITRINVEEKVVAEDIDFKIVTNTDGKLSWREKKITQPGEKGIREIKYRITYKNGKEITRIMLEKNITKNPVTQVVTQGTYMQLGKAAKGQGTWYAYQSGLFAASTTIPKGSYVKVTNTANGKSVVVQINDYGPQGKGRIIDLDKVAFAKIASIGAGVVGVKVEEILN